MHSVFNHLLAALCIADLLFIGGNLALTPIALGKPEVFNPGKSTQKTWKYMISKYNPHPHPNALDKPEDFKTGVCLYLFKKQPRWFKNSLVIRIVISWHLKGMYGSKDPVQVLKMEQPYLCSASQKYHFTEFFCAKLPLFGFLQISNFNLVKL